VALLFLVPYIFKKADHRGFVLKDHQLELASVEWNDDVTDVTTDRWRHVTLQMLNNYVDFAQLKAWWRFRENVNSHPVTCVRIPVSYNKTANINVKKCSLSKC